MVTLYNVIDTRTDQFHSVAIVKERNVKWFRPQPVQDVSFEEVEPEPAPMVEETSSAPVGGPVVEEN